MKYRCTNCHKYFEGEVSFCPHCGAKMAYLKDDKAVADVKEEVTEATRAEPIEEIPAPVEVVEPKEDTSRFNKEFKKALLLDMVTQLAATILTVLLLFLPFFVNEYRVTVGETTTTLKEDFSLFKIVKLFLDSNGAIDFYYFVYEFILAFYLVAGFIITLVFFIKDVFNFMKIDDYYLTKYDNLIHRIEQPRMRRRASTDSFGFFIGGIMFTILILVFDKMEYIGKHYYDGVNGLVTLPIIFLIIGLGFGGYKLFIERNIKARFLKERYNKK